MQNLMHTLAATTPFVGRSQELAEIAESLADPGCRALTLVGPGGIGKTRLSLETATRQQVNFQDGVFFIALQALDTPDLILPAIAEVLDMPVNRGAGLLNQLLEYLDQQQVLLVLDNFEHILEGADFISAIVTGTSGVKMLITSREALNLHEEWVWPVQGLRYPALPQPDEGLADAPPVDNRPLEDYSAIRLFEQSARRTRADFSLEDEKDDVVQICRLLEGMPLAIELAATWVRVLSCREIAQEIVGGLDILSTRARNIPARHSSMRCVMNNSWDFLTKEEQDILKQLAVFRGGFTREAAGAVTGADLPTLSALVDKSLLRYDNTRYGLHELVRQYAEEQLTANTVDAVQTRYRHTGYTMNLLQRQWADLTGEHPREALNTIEREMDNIRAGWRWGVALGVIDDIGKGLDSLWFFYDTRGWYREGVKSFEMACEIMEVNPDSPVEMLIRGRILARLGVLLNSLTRYDEARNLLQEAIDIARRFESDRDTAFALVRYGELLLFEERLEESIPYTREALALYEKHHDRFGAAFAHNCISIGLEPGEEETFHDEQSITLYEACGSRWGIATVLPIIAYHRIKSEGLDEAERTAREALTLCEEIGIQWGRGMSLHTLSFIALQRQDYDKTRHYAIQELTIAIGIHLDQYIARAAYIIGITFLKNGQVERAVRCFAITYHRYFNIQIHEYYMEFERDLTEEVQAKAIAQSQEIDNLVSAGKALLADLKIWTTAAGPADQPLADPLTEREIEILGLVADGLSNREIAGQLYLSPGTVKWYLSQIYGKLGVRSRTQAVAQARELTIIA